MSSFAIQQKRQSLTRFRFKDFSDEELETIQKNLKRRFRDADILELGFGQGSDKSGLDSMRPFCICFFVTNKRMPRDKKKRIPTAVKIRLKRNKQTLTFELPTDVIETKKMKKTGRELRRSGQSNRVTTGAVISWKTMGESGRRYGVISVGHNFTQAEQGDLVFLHKTSSDFITGDFKVRSTASSQIDAALSEFSEQDLFDAGLLPSPPSTFKARSIEQIKSDVEYTRGGLSLATKNNKVPFTFDFYFPTNEEVSELPKLKNVVRVRSDREQPFRPGRSGTLFVNNREQASAMQYAGKKQDFKEGLGQAIIVLLEWAESVLVDDFEMKPQSLKLEEKF